MHARLSAVPVVLVVAAAAAALLLLAGPVRAAGVAPDERAFIEKHIFDFIKVEPDRLHSSALDKVFSAPVYDVEVKITEGGGSSIVHLIVARAGDELVDLSAPSGNADLPQLKKLLNPEFKLRNEQDAQLLQDALDKLYPVRDSSDKKEKAVKHSGNAWTFIRSKFFDNHVGFIFTADADGTITGVKYSLDVP
jgi:hypothetical protein